MNKITRWHEEQKCKDFERLVWRKRKETDGDTAYEMYVVLEDADNAAGCNWWCGGGTFKVTEYDVVDHEYAIDEFGMAGKTVSEDMFARFLLVCNLADFSSIKAFTDKVDAERYMDDLVRTSPWNAR